MGNPIPIALNYGEIILYNIRNNRSSINNIKAPEDCNWANIYQISWYGIPSYIVVGSSVLYKGTDVICQLAIDHKPYPIIEAAKLVTIAEL